MPKLELDLLGSKKKLSAWAGFRLMAAMLHPQDKKMRDEYLLWQVISQVNERNKAGWNNSKILKTNKLSDEFERYGGVSGLMQARSHDEIINLSNKSKEKGYIVGEIIYGILKFKRDPNAPSMRINKIIELIGLVTSDPGKSEKTYKPRVLFKYWKEFNPVSHLWCALRILHTIKNRIYFNKLESIENIPPLLSLSEEIRKFCEASKWHTNMPPLLQKGKTWTPPKSLKLLPAEIKTKKVERWLLRLLKKSN
jgi:hypothetical protein